VSVQAPVVELYVLADISGAYLPQNGACAMKEICHISPAEDHDFQVVRLTWQTVNLVRYQVLEHSKERLVCKRCGKIVDPFPEIKATA
jgi:hypothetical protein